MKHALWMVLLASMAVAQTPLTIPALSTDNVFTGANSFTQTVTAKGGVTVGVNGTPANLVLSGGVSGSCVLNVNTSGSTLQSACPISFTGGTQSLIGTLSNADITVAPNGTGRLTVTGSGIVNATTGFQINGGAPSLHCLVGNGTNYVDNNCNGITLKTNGTTNGSQTVLNLQQGTNITVTDGGSGTITLACPSCLYTLPTQYTKLRCETGLGDGLNAVTAGTYLQSFCYNDSGVTWTITGIKCFTDNNGTSTLNAAGNTLGALLTGAVTCTNSFAAGSQSANVLLTSGDYIKFTWVADGTSKQATWVVSMTQ